ncbi:MAG TPA: Gfo/Idh/MocA family oxidoreductase [Bacteroidales bacterium]|nr:Gfo/Idh/MocA family oxidoreductase [Bacteroidales bacterium]HOK75581.1 Gfo/Idh/MocA family oxidoreductase [Bacteroidales bacterium]HOM40006.1 Gfo/Idh/MocA family oxidoreductase [Bacteroidales bacterium]HOU29997.1 Gfo/Idh/MocA family oxidoreductase [Bacteroidales bacterium]HPP92209.1 Gfo/Idh/MocA family oxidoreductase [Bacteroidales bacterium]
MNKSGRRTFIKRAGVAFAAFTIVPRHVLGGKGYTPPSEQLTKGIIGVGSMGRGHFNYEGTRLLAVCDVDKKHLEEAVALAGGKVDAYHDFRELLARTDIDIVHIATPPHWHGIMAKMAAEAGKDIWCEKPMTRTIGEGIKVVEAVKKHGRMFRLNTWFRFKDNFYGMGTTVKPLKKIVDSGVLGWPLKVTVSGITGFDWKFYWSGLHNLKPEPVPPELDYDFWLGPAPWKPYNPERVHSKFRGYWDYDGGGLGDMGQHYLDPVQYLLGKDNTSPVYVEIDAPQQHWDAVGSWRRITYTYADGCKIVLDGENRDKDAAYIEGPYGKIFKGLKSDIPNLQKLIDSLPDPEPQITTFTESVLTRKKFSLNEENGHRSCTIVNLGVIALRLGRNLKYDPVKQRFVDDEGANRMINQPMREPWTI